MSVTLMLLLIGYGLGLLSGCAISRFFFKLSRAQRSFRRRI